MARESVVEGDERRVCMRMLKEQAFKGPFEQAEGDPLG